MNYRYVFGTMVAMPLLPLMYYQGKRIRASVPKLPEAKGTEGVCMLHKDSQEAIRIVSLGESTIAGVGVETHEEGFTGTFACELSRLLDANVSWKVYARSGYTVSRVHEKLVPKITESQVDLFIIGLGGNDAFTLNSPAKWREGVRTLIGILQAKYPQALIVFCNMPPIKEFPAFTSLIKFTIGNLVEILGDELQKTVAEFDNVFYFGEKLSLKKWINKLGLNVKEEDFFSDGVHPSKLTYQTWAKDIAQKISNSENIKNALSGSRYQTASR